MTDHLRLEPLPDTEFGAWAGRVRRRMAEQRAASGSVAPQDADGIAAGIVARLLPDGLATPDHHVWAAYRGTRRAGWAWLRVTDGEGFLLDLADGDADLLAAVEAEARELGAASIKVNVFGTDEPCRAAVAKRDGYEPAATHMRVRLDGAVPPSSGNGVELRAMADRRLAGFLVEMEAEYAADLVRSGTESTEQAARRRAAAEIAGLLPDGRPAADQLLWSAHDPADGSEVGYLWLQVADRADGLHAFVLDIAVSEGLRRRGYGRAIMVAGERACRGRGVASIGLSVFGFNGGARALYEGLGYEPTEELFRKRL